MGNLLCLFAIGFVGAYVAKKRKLNPFFWFGICAFFGLIPLLIFIFLPRFLKKPKANTPPPVKAAPPLPFPAETIWYYLDENEQQMGPMSFVKLQEMKFNKKLHEDTYIWNEIMTYWKQWKDVFPSE
jgi:hypothetical protein